LEKLVAATQCFWRLAAPQDCDATKVQEVRGSGGKHPATSIRQYVRLEKAGKLDNMLNNKTGRAEARIHAEGRR
jgi:hypothetical protein